jgi:hypothetical protein
MIFATRQQRPADLGADAFQIAAILGHSDSDDGALHARHQ